MLVHVLANVGRVCNPAGGRRVAELGKIEPEGRSP